MRRHKYGTAMLSILIGERKERSEVGAGNGIRTRDVNLGKVALYH
jgi:hypothetical protein